VVRRVFQPVAYGTIHADVCQPDQRELQADVGIREDAHDRERNGERLQVTEVVSGGADSRTEEVTATCMLRPVAADQKRTMGLEPTTLSLGS
jgi:hypothetical protein